MDRLAVILLKPSRIGFYLHTVILLLLITALWFCGLPVLFKLLFTAVLLLAGIWQVRKNRQLPLSVIDVERIELVDEQLVLPWLIVLNFRINESGEKKSGKKLTLALWPDMAAADDLRRLRVWLRNR